MSLTTTNVHGVQSMRIEQKQLLAGNCWITVIVAEKPDNERFELTLFHSEPMPLQGAEFVNFVAQDPA